MVAVIMARKPRVHFAGALYHVMCRGIQGQSISKDDGDRERYLGFLKGSQKRFGYRLYAYVLNQECYLPVLIALSMRVLFIMG